MAEILLTGTLSLDSTNKDIRGAIQKFVDKRKEINTNGWIHLKIYKYIF